MPGLKHGVWAWHTKTMLNLSRAISLWFIEQSACQVNSRWRSSSDCVLERQMDEDKPTTSWEVFSEAQNKAIAAVVGGLLEEALKDHVGELQLEKSCRSTVCLISNLNMCRASNKCQFQLNTGF